MVASGALSVLFLLCLAAVACVSAQSALDYPITYTTCNAGSNCAAGAAGGCRSQQLTQQQQCVSTSSNSLWFTCPTQPQACFRAQYFTDAACTTKIQDLYGACSVCQGSYFQANANAFYACGNANGATGVMTISQGCSTTNCTSGCKNVTTVPALGQCVFDGVGYIAVSEIYQCLVAQRQTTIPQGACPTPVPDTTTTLVQGACYSDFTTNNMISVTCNEFVTSPPSTWMTPFTTAAPTQPPPTATVITKAPTAGTTTTAPGVVPPPPPPQTTAVGATLVSRLSCTDQRYCNPSTCTAVLNGTGPNGATLATECVGEGSMNFVKFQCPVNGASSSQCVTVAHYADTACSTVMAEDTLVCNQCFGDGVTSQWLHVTCGSGGITVQTCTDAACTTCSAGATNLATGVCVNSPADTMSVGFAVERGPFACNSILAEFYHYDNTCKANHFASLFIPDGYCRFGNVVTCPSTAPAPSDLPAPSTAVPAVSGESLMLVVSNCADVHCSQSCSTAEAAPTGICDLATFTGELPAADPTASDYTELFECLPSQGQGWVVSLFTNSSCTQVEDQLVLACGICQRSFVTGDYFSLSCGPTLQINQGCDSTCQNCASTRVMMAGQCNQDYAGNYLMPQRHTAFGTLIRHTVYTGVQCRGTPVVSYTSVSGECESRRRLTCANQPPATAPVGDVPSTFEGTFDYPPDAAAFTAALRTFSFQNSASVVFTSSVVSERCGLDMCYVVSFQITGDQATLVAQELYRLRYTHPITLDRWFNMTSLTAAPTDDKQGSSSEVVTVAVVCGVIAFVLFVAAMCFARRRNQKLSKEDILEGEDYVAMSETSSVSSVTK